MKIWNNKERSPKTKVRNLERGRRNKKKNIRGCSKFYYLSCDEDYPFKAYWSRDAPTV
jgi:hypothetical protein